MLTRIQSALNTLLHDIKRYIKTINSSQVFLLRNVDEKKLNFKKINLSFNNKILQERSKTVLNGHDFFLGGTFGEINGLDGVPKCLLFLQNVPYFFIKAHRFNKHGDIKIVWDRFRGYHFPVLALSKPEELYSAIQRYKTTLFLGFSWSSPMEVAFRTINIVLSLSLLSEETRNKIPKDVFIVLHQHLAYLHNNFEVGKCGHTNNHYLSNIIAAELLSQVLGVAKQPYRNSVIAEINKQFCDDGSNFEGSTSYHFLSTELLFWFYILDQEEHSGYIELLENAVAVCKLLTDSSGNIPYIGDNDSGAVVKLLVNVIAPKSAGKQFIYRRHDIPLIENLSNYGDRTEAFINNVTAKGIKEFNEVSNNQFSLSGLKKVNTSIYPFSSEYKIYYLAGLSLFVIKTKSQFLTIKCGPLGQLGRGGHDHHDQGSFTFADSLLGTCVRDVGTGSYSGYYSGFSNCRSVTSHNNFIDKRQALFDSSKPFRSSHPPGEFKVSDNEVVVVVNYGDFTVARRFSFGTDLKIEDFIEEDGEMVSRNKSDVPYFYSMYGVKA